MKFFMNTTDNTNTWLTIFYQNIRGLSVKSDEMMCSLISNKFTPHLICLSEHYTTIQNYQSFH
jgi:hypothetical protein